MGTSHRWWIKAQCSPRAALSHLLIPVFSLIVLLHLFPSSRTCSSLTPDPPMLPSPRAHQPRMGDAPPLDDPSPPCCWRWVCGPSQCPLHFCFRAGGAKPIGGPSPDSVAPSFVWFPIKKGFSPAPALTTAPRSAAGPGAEAVVNAPAASPAARGLLQPQPQPFPACFTHGQQF